MSKPIDARGLASIQIQPVKDRDSVALVMIDTANHATGYLINPEALNVLLEPLLGLATKWANQPDLKLETLVGPRHALPAQRIAIERGRNAKECAVRIFIGKVELTFLIPLEEVLAASADLVRQIDPSIDDAEGPSH